MLQSATRLNARWTQDELFLAVQGVRTYGKNFRAIAEVLGTKTEAHVRSFFVNQRQRYNLDEVLRSYEQEHGIAHSSTTNGVTKPEDANSESDAGKADNDDAAVKSEVKVS